MIEIAFRADRRDPEPVHRQLAARLRAWIEAGRLAVGERLPPTRELARTLGLARNTVTLAYEHLADLGLVHGHVGRGTIVSARRPGPPPPRGRPWRRLVVAPAAAPRPFAWDALVALRARNLPATHPPRADDGELPPFDFRGGRVHPDPAAARALARAVARGVDRHGERLLRHVDPCGWPPLREAIARGLLARGIACDADDVVIVAGAQQALDVVARVLLDPGDVAVVEQPGYFGAALAFRACGAHLVGVRVDGEGLRTDELARLVRARRAKLVYATPGVQSPTRVALAEARRDALLALADAHQLPVVEDDYDAVPRLDGPAAPALKATDPAGQVIYVGSVSKTFLPGVRLGWVVAARPLLDRVARAVFASTMQASPLLQAGLAELLASGAIDRHVRRVRRRYAERVGVLRAALADAMPAGTHVTPPAGGTGCWVTLPAWVDADATTVAARAAGVRYDRGDAFFLDAPPIPCLSLSVATVPRERIAEGVARLAASCGTPTARRRGSRAS